MPKTVGDFFDKQSRCCSKRARRKGVWKSSKVLLEELHRAGIEGRTVLEIGCGVGELSRTVLRDGAARVTGVDLSSKSLEEARRISAEQGLADRTEFVLADALTEPLPESDVLVMDRVLCCTPRAVEMLSRAVPITKNAVGFVVPYSKGVASWPARIFNMATRGFCRVIRSEFRPYVHDTRKLDESVRAHGFTRTAKRLSYPWIVMVYSR